MLVVYQITINQPYNLIMSHCLNDSSGFNDTENDNSIHNIQIKLSHLNVHNN